VLCIYLAVLDDKFVVFSGGSNYTEPVSDTQTYQLDTHTREWSILPTKGQPPHPCQGHVLVAVANKVQILMSKWSVSLSCCYTYRHVLNNTTAHSCLKLLQVYESKQEVRVYGKEKV